MNQPRSITLTIPEPCAVPWNTMHEVDDVRRNCESCATVVTDFSGMTDDELVAFLHHRKDQKSCGRFHSSQLNRPLVLLPAHTRKAVWWKAAVLLPFSLFSKNSQAQQQDSVAVAADSVVAVIDTVTVADTTQQISQVDSLAQDSAHLELFAPTDFQLSNEILTCTSISTQGRTGFIGVFITHNYTPPPNGLPALRESALADTFRYVFDSSRQVIRQLLGVQPKAKAPAPEPAPQQPAQAPPPESLLANLTTRPRVPKR